MRTLEQRLQLSSSRKGAQVKWGSTRGALYIGKQSVE